jgi:hypothetical protein
LIGELGLDPTVLGDGALGPTEFAVAFAESKDGSGGSPALVIESADSGLVGADGGFEIAVDLFFEQPLLEMIGDRIGGPRRCTEEDGNHDRKEDATIQDGFHGEDHTVGGRGGCYGFAKSRGHIVGRSRR